MLWQAEVAATHAVPERTLRALDGPGIFVLIDLAATTWAVDDVGLYIEAGSPQATASRSTDWQVTFRHTGRGLLGGLTLPQAKRVATALSKLLAAESWVDVGDWLPYRKTIDQLFTRALQTPEDVARQVAETGNLEIATEWAAAYEEYPDDKEVERGEA